MDQSDNGQQEHDWQVLHDCITEILDQFAIKDCRGRANYWLVDDNYGHESHYLEIRNLDLFQFEVVSRLQSALSSYPRWNIRMSAYPAGADANWPDMGIIIYQNEIFDELDRNYLPERFQTMIFGTIPPPPETQEQLAEKVRKLMKPKP